MLYNNEGDRKHIHLKSVRMHTYAVYGKKLKSSDIAIKAIYLLTSEVKWWCPLLETIYGFACANEKLLFFSLKFNKNSLLFALSYFFYSVISVLIDCN